MNAAPISVNLAACGNAGGGVIGQATRASTLPAFAQVMAQKQAEASAPKDTAAATSGAENTNAANGSADAAAQKSSDNGPVNAKSPARGNAETAKKSDAKEKSSSGAGAGKSAAQTAAQVPPQNAAQVPAIPGGLNGAAPWVGGAAAVIPVEQVVNAAVSTATTGAATTDATGVKGETTKGTGTSDLTNPIAPDFKNLPASVLSALVVPTTAAQSSAASAPATEAASGGTTTPATASSEDQKNPQMPVAAATVVTAAESTSSINAANLMAGVAVQSLPAAGNEPAAQNAAASSGDSQASATATAASEPKAGDLDATAAAALPATDSTATSAQAAPKNQGKRSVQEILRGAAALAVNETQAAARAGVNPVKDVVGTFKGKSSGNGSGTETAGAPVVGAKNESPVSVKPEPVTPEVAEALEKPGTAKAGSNIKGNSSADENGNGNSGSAGSVGDSKDSEAGAASNAVHGAMSAGQNDPSNLAAGTANAVAVPVAISGKDSANAMPVKAGDASNNAAPAAPDADDAAPSPNESHRVNMAQLAGDQGHSQVRIAMQADQLGQVELHATVHGQLVGAAITVEKKEAHAAMAAEMPSLQQALEDRQLRVGEVVLMQGALHSTAGDAGNAAAEQQRRGQAGTTYQQVENETMYEASAGTIFEGNGIFDDSGRLSVRA